MLRLDLVRRKANRHRGTDAMDRKAFLRRAGVWSGAALWAGCARDRESEGIEGAPQGEDLRPALNPPLDRVGLQLYTLRALMAEDVAATLDAVAAIGYDEVEFAGYFGYAPRTVKEWLDGSGLTAPAAHVSWDDLAGPGQQSALEAAVVLGHRWLVLPWIPAELRTREGYREVAAMLNTAGAAAGEAGIRVAYHNHAFEFEPMIGAGEAQAPTGYEVLLRHLDPSLVDLEIDFHWSTVGGADPDRLFAAYPGRFKLCHVKDVTDDGQMADVGAGTIDWASIFAGSGQAGLLHAFVEHDHPADPLASAEASYRYLSAG